MKDLPKVFHNNVNKEFKSNNSVFYSRNSTIQDEVKDSQTILQKINDIFSYYSYLL